LESRFDSSRYVGNIGAGVTENTLLSVFSTAGDVKFIRIQGEPSGASRFAFIEFSEQRGAIEGLKYNGTIIGDRPVKVIRSKNAVVKVRAKLIEATRGAHACARAHPQLPVPPPPPYTLPPAMRSRILIEFIATAIHCAALGSGEQDRRRSRTKGSRSGHGAEQERRGQRQTA